MEEAAHGLSSGIVLAVSHIFSLESRNRAGWELLFMLIEFQFCCFSAENDGRRLDGRLVADWELINGFELV